jgi:hypothetical protein
VESSCELGDEPSGSIKCWELPNGCTTCGLSSGTQLHRVSLILENNSMMRTKSSYTIHIFRQLLHCISKINRHNLYLGLLPFIDVME